MAKYATSTNGDAPQRDDASATFARFLDSLETKLKRLLSDLDAGRRPGRIRLDAEELCEQLAGPLYKPDALLRDHWRETWTDCRELAGGINPYFYRRYRIDDGTESGSVTNPVLTEAQAELLLDALIRLVEFVVGGTDPRGRPDDRSLRRLAPGLQNALHAYLHSRLGAAGAKRTRVSREEAKERVSNALKARRKKPWSVRDLHEKTGVSTGQICSLDEWKEYEARMEAEGRKPSRGRKAVAFSGQVEATIGVVDETLEATKSGDLESQRELLRQIAQQVADDKETGTYRDFHSAARKRR